MLYVNEVDHIAGDWEEGWEGKGSKYFEICNLVKEHYGGIWHCSLS